jgi:hypothetical protein
MAAGAASADCRQALAIGLDVSGSVDRAERALQIEGMAAALTAPGVLASLLELPEVPVRVAVFLWSGPAAQDLIVPWTAVTDEAAAAAIAARLRAAPVTEMPEATAIGSAMLYGAALLGVAGGCWRLTLDLSGDGRSNAGPWPADVAVRSGGRDVTVNALVVALPEMAGASPGVAELTSYFGREVIRGPDAFVEVALGFSDFAAAMERKLKRELAIRAAEGPGLRTMERLAGR